ncbi:MAG: hypothetical protein ABI771_15760, partial [Betaproteobacteria bacterium]
LTNLGGTSVSNVRLWVGTRDDYIATRDSQFKFKGNLTGTGFEQIATQNEQSKALKITEFNDGQGAAVLFYSTSDGADTSIAQCCSFSNATGIDPRTSPIFRGQSGGLPSPEDGSYALFIRLADLAPGQHDGMTWYYAAGPVSTLDSIVAQVATSAGAVAAAPAALASPTTLPVVTAISGAQAIASDTSAAGAIGVTLPDGTVSLPGVTADTSSQGGVNLGTSGGLSFIGFPPDGGSTGGVQEGGSSADAGGINGEQSAQGNQGDAASDPLLAQEGGKDAAGFMRVFVVGGGTHLPREAEEGQGLQVIVVDSSEEERRKRMLPR